MQQPSNADGGDGTRKAKLLALLDQARVNRGLQPEQRVSIDEDQAMDSNPPIKTESSAAIKAEMIHSPHYQNQFSHSHPSSPVFRGTTQRRNKDEAMHTESSAEHRVAVLNSTQKPRIADLTGGRERISALQQLKPLGVPRINTQPVQEPREKHTGKLESREKYNEKKELPLQNHSKHPRKTPANTSVTLKKLQLLTPDEYEDFELHSDFQHMIHILIPSNATAALLERRGQPIQSISQQTDCTLSIREPETSPFKDDRLLRIYGKAKGISLAQRLVIAHIRAYRVERGDPNYMDLSEETHPVALPATSITKAMSVAVASGKKPELEITSPFVWMIQREDVGKIMGLKGSIIAAIRQNTGVAIRLDDSVVPGTTERRVVLTGSVDSITAAIEKIKSRAGGRPEVAASTASGRLGQYFAIPYRAAGFLIGPQGSTVRSITDRTGARLQVPSAEDLPLGSINRILHMQGNPKQAEHARRIIGAKLRDFLSSPSCPRTLNPSSTGKKGDEVTIKVLLPSRICSLMLDQRGKLIREISDKSGAYTYFLAPHGEENRVCVFSGDMCCVLRAQRLVLQVIAGDAISSKRVVPPRKRKRSQREEVVEYAQLEEEDKYVDEEEHYSEDHVEEEYYTDEYEETPRRPYRENRVEEEYYTDEYEAPRQAIRRQIIRHQPPRRPQHDYEDEEHYRHEDFDGVEYERRPRQPVRKRSAATRPRKYIEDEYVHDQHTRDEYVHDEFDPDEYTYAPDTGHRAPRLRQPKRPLVVRRQPPSRRRDEYEGEYAEYDDEYTNSNVSDDYASDSSAEEYEHSLLTRKQVVKRRPTRRPPVLRPGRKVQMVVPRSGSRESRPRMSPTDRPHTNGHGTIRPSRGGLSRRVPRGGRGGGRVNASRGRGNPNKRRRQ
ncbi:Flowering locus K y domain [Phytophthora citrophthora]|uniref:Flowering locus K y domain n=1 Tax=Phytophthora citrophthora TaxID=4793 RepID=A0AAD9G094_9STRA|nr:Flowering locus K y domain [Phytophthora citrophthora]